jgi:SAM-dependent methyltransferase
MKNLSQIVELASAYYGSCVLFAAVETGLFESVEKGEFDSSSRGMRLLADACVSQGLLVKNGPNDYSNTPAGRLALIPGAANDLTKALKYNMDVYPAWGKLAEFARTSKPVERPSIHLGENLSRTKAFAAAMFSRALGIGRGVVPILGELKGRLLDLAGGPGAYAILMCQSNPSLQVVSVDVPVISNEAKQYVSQYGLSSRIECRSGDYHTDLYEQGAYDFVTIFGALHQESPEQIVSILKRASDALIKGGRIYILDLMTDDTHTMPPFSALFPLNMALTTENGWVFSQGEIKSYLEQAGFECEKISPVPPPMPHFLVSAIKR